MKKILLIPVYLLSLISITIQCCPKDIDQELLCYEFDQRQCGGDVWSEDVPLGISKSEREMKMKDFLDSQDIEVSDVIIMEDYHEFVCEACNICPELDRFFVKIAEEDLSKLEALELLNFEKVLCSDVF